MSEKEDSPNLPKEGRGLVTGTGHASVQVCRLQNAGNKPFSSSLLLFLRSDFKQARVQCLRC